MVSLSPAITTITATFAIIRPAAILRGTNPIAIHDGSQEVFDLPDVSSNVYTTILLSSLAVEYVGILETVAIELGLIIVVNGNGLIRWQISGDGGNNWSTISDRSFNYVVFTPISDIGTGTWLTTINTGNNQLQLRLQALANVGIVSTKLAEDSAVEIEYRQKIVATE